ncbi:MAG: hypothetical protein JSS61_04715 [Verrucomicrobia bacterium]|nr:hypothetical protein [Verrucomicrobiota bacterium]
MSLRYRLFLWVSGLFLATALISLVTSSRVMHKELAQAQGAMREKILEISEKKRLDIENFLAESLLENHAEIDSALTDILQFKPQILRFGPTRVNAERGTWEDVADLLFDNRWIDFLQNTNEGDVTASVTLKEGSLLSTERTPIDAGLTWVYLKGRVEPYLGVRVPYGLSRPSASQEQVETLHGTIPEYYLLFDPQKMAVSPPLSDGTLTSFPVTGTSGYEILVEPFIEAFRRAQMSLRAKTLSPGPLPQIPEDVCASGAASAAAVLSSRPAEEFMQRHVIDISERYTQLSLVWLITAFFNSGTLGDNLFAFPAPEGACLFSSDEQRGCAMRTEGVLRPKKLFDDALYYAQHAPINADLGLANSLAVIDLPDSNWLYLGNTAQFIVESQGKERKGYLTLGIDASTMLQKLVLAFHQTALLAHGGKWVCGVSPQGERIPIDGDLPLAEMLQKKSGIISSQGENLFFLHIVPFPKIDLHFFLLNSEAKEFSFLNDLEEGSEHVINSILLNIHITGFIVLLVAIFMVSQISRRITKPIIELANATEGIIAGKYEEVKAALPIPKVHDEIAILCGSFRAMVEGLQEREKVKGVLNKVVSREIAEEILAGSISLGGEVKRLTVLFADIRGFSHMTQQMRPEEIIALLNTCMTKISSCIDQRGGVIDKYVGDEAMALFGVPIPLENSALRAIESALDIIAVLEKWNQERGAQHLPPIEMGIGIHTSEMLAGNMGAENRLNYTVIGSGVNLAFRMCAAAKGMQIFITKDTLSEPLVREKIAYEALPPMTFKGFDQPVEIYSVKGLK